jgi:dTDP-D-glucose 4,6-dehydratase
LEITLSTRVIASYNGIFNNYGPYQFPEKFIPLMILFLWRPGIPLSTQSGILNKDR